MTIFIHDDLDAFYAQCRSDYCHVEGISRDRKVRYSIQILESAILDWKFIHEHMVDSIDRSISMAKST